MSEMRKSFLCLILAVLFLAGWHVLPQNATSAEPSQADLDKVPRISIKDFKALLDAGEKVTIVDTRTREEYDEEHIQGSLFFDDVEARYSELAKDTKFVLY